MPSARLCRVAARPHPVGAGPQLHPAQDLAFGQDRDQHGQHQEHEDGQRLAQDQPPGVVPEAGHACVTPIFTTLPRCDAQLPVHRRARRVQRQPHHPVGHVGDRQRQGDRAARGADRDLVAVGGADLGRGLGRQPHHRACARCRPDAARRPATAPSSSSIRQPVNTASPAPGWALRPRRRSAPAARLPSQVPSA